MSNLIIAGREFSSRLFLGTGKFNNNSLMASAIQASETEMVTVAMKRIELNDQHDDLLTHITQNQSIQLLPNTSGVRNAEEAVFAAQMSREAFGTNWLKLEIHPDPRYLLPDSIETLKATEELVKLGFVVLPYCQADPTLCKHLEEAGSAITTKHSTHYAKRQQSIRAERKGLYAWLHLSRHQSRHDQGQPHPNSGERQERHPSHRA